MDFTILDEDEPHSGISTAICVADALSALAGSEEVDAAIGRAFETIGAGLGLGRVYYFENKGSDPDDPSHCSLRHEWCRASVPAQGRHAEFEAIAYDDVLPGAVGHFQQGRSAFLELTPDETTVRGLRILAPTSRSLLAPVLYMNSFRGFLGFDWLDDRAPDDDHRAALRALATGLATALELELDRRAAQHQLHHDPLTDLPNRLAFGVAIEEQLHHARANGTVLGILCMDVDAFKRVNDSLGHAEGDGLLCSLAERMRDLLGARNPVFRMGGDEFALLLPDRPTSEDVEHAALLLLDACRDTYRLPSGSDVHATVSIGLSVFPDDDPEADASQYMRFADTALFRAKAQGRNRVERFTPAVMKGVHRRLSLEGQLRQAVRKNELQVWLQPQYPLDDDRPDGGEALLRWPRAAGGFVSPAEFIPIAEETGLIVPITEFVVGTVCAAWRDLSTAARRPMRLAVNVSPAHFRYHDVTGMLLSAVSGTGVPDGGLEIELTEGALMVDPDEMRQRLREVRDLGFRIAIDDFGTGYSSLAALRHYPLDWLKIDRSFVADIPKDPGAIAIAEVILSMARTLGLRTMAEGVETAEQLEALRARGCDGFQGYLRSPAVPIPRFRELIAEP